MGRYAFPLCVQLTLPDNMADAGFLHALDRLERLGLYGVELNVTDFDAADPVRLASILGDRGLRMTMLATGVYAFRRGLSLSTPEEALRRQTVAAMRDTLLPFARAMGCGVICGFIKGTAGHGNEALLVQSLEEIGAAWRDGGVDIYLEATNHHESAVVNRLRDGARLIKPPFHLLPDTYHMNIEEDSVAAALTAHRGLYDNLHLSDNNRRFPGFGSFDFPGLFRLLKALDYGGTMAIEGRCRRVFEEDLEKSCAYLKAISDMME